MFNDSSALALKSAILKGEQGKSAIVSFEPYGAKRKDTSQDVSFRLDFGATERASAPIKFLTAGVNPA